MGAKNILTETIGDVEWIIFNRQEKLNSMTREDLLFISKHLHDIATNKTSRAVIFTGSGDKAFSAGMDFHEFNQLTPQEAYLLISDLKNVCQLIRKIPQPVIMAINGYCIGGAMEMCVWLLI
ncbi:enoyl-CoA hydratase/isomerase family protein [Neobacillus sp. MM2021_6]|uniref:enoyl-CoA hydratase/isomerase family protein n=1 Tax=Bacillaceae TaxID=186817 RepID=UPI001408B5BC|nr:MULTISPECIES: enoyl-CoA hydratase/isomerase family protein [Bacillaceae]MBO0959976.1 enoyl-CoA hydratase/isomerase family protein [Neobacillus sp. MM2021_6]NHC18702.1 enoyl-CoA hydratase/isomerase family protein [Bacillus sp. MM2020_4]